MCCCWALRAFSHGNAVILSLSVSLPNCSSSWELCGKPWKTWKMLVHLKWSLLCRSGNLKRNFIKKLDCSPLAFQKDIELSIKNKTKYFIKCKKTIYNSIACKCKMLKLIRNILFTKINYFELFLGLQASYPTSSYSVWQNRVKACFHDSFCIFPFDGDLQKGFKLFLLSPGFIFLIEMSSW